MTVIGVTGTNGKSTTVALIASALESDGAKVGATSTVSFKIADKETLNNKKMTMLGRFQLQKLLSQMVKAGCKYAVIEVSSEGIKQSRHIGIKFDYAVFTNLTPEHLESHGGFDNYKKAKAELFKRFPSKTSIINLDDKHAQYFLDFPAAKKLTFAIENKDAQFKASQIEVKSTGTSFHFQEQDINMQLIGKFNVYNAMPALLVGLAENIPIEKLKQGLEKVPVVPGRTEVIKEGQDFTVLVDYAPEPYALKKLYETLTLMKYKRLIHVLGSCGGGRDVARRPILGKMAGIKADIVIITNEDPYNDDPMQIIDQVAEGAIEQGKVGNQNLFKILDRKEAIQKALNLAETGDLVLVTGKGSEQAMAVADGKYVTWDDRKVIRECLSKIR